MRLQTGTNNPAEHFTYFEAQIRGLTFLNYVRFTDTSILRLQNSEKCLVGKKELTKDIVHFNSEFHHEQTGEPTNAEDIG